MTVPQGHWQPPGLPRPLGTCPRGDPTQTAGSVSHSRCSTPFKGRAPPAPRFSDKPPDSAKRRVQVAVSPALGHTAQHVPVASGARRVKGGDLQGSGPPARQWRGGVTGVGAQGVGLRAPGALASCGGTVPTPPGTRTSRLSPAGVGLSGGRDPGVHSGRRGREAAQACLSRCPRRGQRGQAGSWCPHPRPTPPQPPQLCVHAPPPMRGQGGARTGPDGAGGVQRAGRAQGGSGGHWSGAGGEAREGRGKEGGPR